MDRTDKPIILVVDDEHNIADTTAEILSLFGFETLKAYNAEEALAIALEYAPALVLSDVILPGKNGVDFAIELTDKRPNCKIVLFSGNTGTTLLLERAKAEGYDFDILVKPIHPEQLVEHLKMHLSAEASSIAPH